MEPEAALPGRAGGPRKDRVKKFIVVAGNIGVGKSTLVGLLSTQLGWQPFYEPVAENPYLADFYSDMPRWSFQSQIFFLANRLASHRQLLDHPTSVVQDRSVYEDAEIFARNLYDQGYLAERDYTTYCHLYDVLVELLPPPDLVIYLRASVATLQQRIARRGRDYESRIRPLYLAQLNALYEHWIERFSLCPVLTVPADELDYVAHSAHLGLIVSKVHEKLQGKEEVLFSHEEVRQASAQA
jgi:deoxyadenosine/deoxycytidine kinase